MSVVPLEDQAAERLKRSASLLSLSTNVGLTAIKIAAAVVTGSVSLASESIHSATDVIASLITFLSVRAAAAPPDEDHPYGHGKIENLAGFAESILLLLVVGYILVEAGKRLIVQTAIQQVDAGCWTMAISAVATLCVGAYVRIVARKTDSMALESNGRHILIDFCTSLGVLIALGLTKFGGWEKADAWVAIGLAIWIAVNAFFMGFQAIQQLIDRRISDDEMARIVKILDNSPGLISFHRLRTRHSGNVHYIDLHAVVPNDWTVVQGHALADQIEKRMEKDLHPARVVVHIDPFDVTKLGDATKPGP